jgi:protoporphyrinogen oxidase
VAINTDSTDGYDCIVIGGGISGLTLASRRAARDGRVLLLEAEGRLGGCIETWRPRDDFCLELGAHTAYNSYGALLAELELRAGLSGLLPREKAGYFFFEQGQTVSPLRRLSIPRLLLNLPLGLMHNKAMASVGDYYRALFGVRNYERLLAPAFAAVLSQPAEDYPAAWLFRKKPRVKQAPRKYSHTGGLQGLIEALATGLEIRTGTPVLGISRNESGYAIQTATGELASRQLALATPADVTARLLCEAHPEIAALLSDIQMVRIETLAVMVKRDAVRLPKLAGLIGDAAPFFSAVSRDPLPHPELRGFAFHFRPGVLSAVQKRRTVSETLAVSEDQWLGSNEKINRLPRLTVEHVPLAATIDAQTRALPLALVGNYLNGLSLGDCAERARREGERLASQKII